MRFQEIPGQQEIKARLVQAVRTGRVSHALLFSGSSGSGHYPLALALAQYLQCKSPTADDSCGVCPSCHQAAQFVHPDIHFIFPVARTGKSTGEPVSDEFIGEWRQLLSTNPFPNLDDWYEVMGIENKQAGIFKSEAQSIIRKMSFKSYEADYKVVIFWLPEKMNTTAANKLLKIIEEPSAFTIFLFVTEQPDQILPTVLSRTQLIKVPKIGEEDLRKKLLADYPDNEDNIDWVVRMARGDYLKAREMINQREQVIFFREKFIAWMRMAYGLKVGEIRSWVDEMSDIGREKQKAFLTYGLRMIRENFLLNRGMPELVSLDPEEQGFSSRFNAFIHPANIEGLTRELGLGISQISMNANPRILFTDMSLQIHGLLSIPAVKS